LKAFQKKNPSKYNPEIGKLKGESLKLGLPLLIHWEIGLSAAEKVGEALNETVG
jgi:hypothetical protein